jgi:hypothetical protein
VVLGPLRTLQLHDVHSQPTCGSLMPDFAGCHHLLPAVKEFYVELLGECKDLENLTSTNLRRLESYAISVFGSQPLRYALYGFLATCKEVIFVRFERPIDGSLDRPAHTRPFLPFARTPRLLWNEGVRILANLLTMSKEARGTVQEIPRAIFPPPVGEVVVDGYLGRGRTAVVYRATLPTMVAALKVYEKEWDSAMENEYRCLERLKATRAAVLRVVAFSRKQYMMLLAPVAVPLSQLYATVELTTIDTCI